MALFPEIRTQELLLLLVLVPFVIIAENNVRQNMIDTIRRQQEPAEQETKKLGLNDGDFIKSAHFPSECCEARQFLIHYEDEVSSEGYLRMIFDDLDLPKGTILQVHDGTNMSAPAFFEQPYYRKGAWIRPVFATTGPSLFIKLTPRKHNPVSVDHVGFTANIWTSNTGPNMWTLGKPFTECPVLADAVDGGSLSLSTLLLFGKTNFRYDCIWQLRPPADSSNLQVFVKITDVDLVDALVTINDGFSSESEQALRLEGTTSALNEDTSRTYTSSKGFYIRIQKPVETGHVNFTFGVYKRTSKSDCSLRIDGKKVQGFKCVSDAWCVPYEYKCNGIPQCPDGSDEKIDICNTYQAPTAAVPTSDTPPKTTTTEDPTVVRTGEVMVSLCTDMPTFFKKCDDGTCVSKYEGCNDECGYFERKCPDGTCVNKNYGTCPTEKKCNYNEKKCTSDNTCVDSRGKCRNEVCPPYKPNECQNKIQCYYDSDHCSGFGECSDNSDEVNCPVHTGKTPWETVTETWKLWLLALLIPLMCCCCGFYKYKRRKRRRNQSRNSQYMYISVVV